MCPSRTGTIVLTIGFAIGASCMAAPDAGLRPDPAAQTKIEEAAAAIVRQDEGAAERIEALRHLGAGRRGDLLLQIALYLRDSDGTERSMAGALILHALNFTPEETIGAVLPHLDARDDRLRRVLTEMLGAIDRREGGGPEFGVYVSWLTGRGGAPPPALVRYLYGVSPVDAALCMQRVYGAPGSRLDGQGRLAELREILARRDASRALTPQERSRALAIIEELSRDPAWWIRRCVAAALHGAPEIEAPALARRLEEDPDPLVRDTLPR